MLKSERTALDVLFPEVRAKLLRSLFTTPLKERYVRELKNMSGLALHTVQDELRKLSAVGLLSSWSNGYHRFIELITIMRCIRTYFVLSNSAKRFHPQGNQRCFAPEAGALRRGKPGANPGRCPLIDQ